MNLYCCKYLEKFLKNKNIPIKYNKIEREYSIILRGGGSLQVIRYCPFCSKKFPDNLSDKYFEILQKEYNIESPFNPKENEYFPDDFKSDLWWKKRGL